MDGGAASRGAAPAIIPPNLEFEQLSFNPSDLSLLETQEWNARVLATAYGVPAVILNMALQGGLTYQNPAALGEMWWRFELRPTATRIANAFSAQMLPRGQWVQLRRGRHLRADHRGLRGGRPAALAGGDRHPRRSSNRP